VAFSLARVGAAAGVAVLGSAVVPVGVALAGNFVDQKKLAAVGGGAT
jgi:hypothetical protein